MLVKENKHQSIGQLIGIIHRASFGFFNKEANSRLGLSYGQFFLLNYINHHPGSSQHDIQGYLGRDKGNVSVLIKELMNEGYLTRKVDERDKRVLRIFPTDKASNKSEEIHEILKQWTELMLMKFSPGERLLLFEMLERLIGNLDGNI